MKFKLLKEALEIHLELNPKLYNEDSSLREDVSEALLKISREFINGLEENNIPIRVVDIWLVGSNASYNYSTTSDIDVHIIANFDDVSEEKDLLTILYNYVKSDFNKNYDIKVKGLEVELYIEDMDTTSITNGIYSILHNEWIKFPTPIEFPTELQDVEIKDTDLYINMYELYLDLKTNFNKEDIQDYINRLYIMRKASLINEGEFGIGNLVFKELRNQGVIEDLKKILKDMKSKELTLEKLEESQ